MTAHSRKFVSLVGLSVLFGASLPSIAACMINEQGEQKTMECDAETMAKGNDASTADRQRGNRRIAPATAATLAPNARLNGAALQVSPISEEDAARSKRATLKHTPSSDDESRQP